MSEKKNSMDVPIWDAIKEGFANIDARSWPGVLMFLVLIAIEAGANLVASLPDFGWIVASLVAMLFGVFMGAWHIITERERNSKRQQSTAEGMVKIIGGLSIALLITNLIRLASNGATNWETAWSSLTPTAAYFGGWDIFAVLLIAIAFGFHLFGYLQWHDNDKGRADRREHAEKMAAVDAKEKNASLAVRRAEVQLIALDAEETKVAELQTRFGHLPAAQLNRILNEARKEIREAFEKKYNVDLDGDGKIGPGKPQNEPQRAQPPALAKGAPSVALRQYALSEFLESIDQTAESAREMLKQYNLNTADEAWKVLKQYGMLPSDLTRKNFNSLYAELDERPNERRGGN